MKKLLGTLTIFTFLFAWVSAEYKATIKNYGEVEWKITYSNELDFEISRDDYKVEASWNEYEKSDFKYYKLVKSYTHDNPVYPNDTAVFVGMTAQDDENTFKDWSTKVGYFRVCVVKTDESIVCSNVEKLSAYEQEKKYEKKPVENCIQMIQPAYHPVTWECRDFSTPCSVKTGWKKVNSCDAKEVILKQEQYNDRKNTISNKKDEDANEIKVEKDNIQEEYMLNRVMKKRADSAVNSLINNLEKQKISTEKKWEKLEVILTKLDSLEEKLSSAQAVWLVKYLKAELKIKKEMFEQVDDIEEIFNIISD